MNQTQPNSRTLIGLIIGAIVLVAGLLLISNAGRSGTDTPPPSPTRVSLQATATPEAEPSPTPAAQTRNEEEDPDADGFIGDADFCPEFAGAIDGCPDTDGDGISDDKDDCADLGDQGYGIDGVGCPNLPTDRDNDGIFDNDDTCPDRGDEGYGVDSVGCPLAPPPPSDRDNDGVTDDVDSCPDDGDLGNGVDGVGCPIPPPDPEQPPVVGDANAIYEFTGQPVGATCQVTVFNGDALVAVLDGVVVPDSGVISGTYAYDVNDIPDIRFEIGCAISAIPDNAPAVMPYRFENVGPEDNCSVQVMNIGDGEPAALSEIIAVTPDENGIVEGEIGILLGAGDIPEAVIMCIGTAPLPPAIAAFEYSFEVPSGLNCSILITDADGNVVDSFPAVPDENGIVSGIYEFDPGVVISPVAQIGCVPNVAPAMMPYEFTGLSGVVCTVTIVNIGDGDPADFGNVSGLIPDQNGTISGFISILLGEGDTPEAQIGCVPFSAPSGFEFEYEFTDIADTAICTVTIVNVGDGEPATLGVVDGLVADENGVIRGMINLPRGENDTPEANLSCILTIPAETTETVGEAVGAQTFTFSAPDDFPPDVAFCDVIVSDSNSVELQIFNQLIPNENGVIEVVYEYEVGAVSEPLSAQIVCAIADNFGNPEVTPEATVVITPVLDYIVNADLQCVPIIDDARTFAQVSVNLTATGNYRQSYEMTWVSGDTTVQNAIGLNSETGTLIFFVPLGTGQASGTLTLVAYDETPALVSDETWVFDVTCAETAYELSPEFWCQRNDNGDLTFLGVFITGSGNYPLNYQSTWVSGDYTYGPVTSVWNSTISTFNLAYEPGAGMTTGTLTLVPYNIRFELMTELTIVYELDCTPEAEATPEPELTPAPEETPAPNPFELSITPACANNPDSITFRVEATGALPTGEFTIELASGMKIETSTATYSDGEVVFYTIPLNTGLNSASIRIIYPDASDELFSEFSCDVTISYNISASPTCGTNPNSITFAVTATGTLPTSEFGIALTSATVNNTFTSTLVADDSPVFYTIDLADGETSAMLTITDSANYEWIFAHDCADVDLPDVYAVYFGKDWYQRYYETNNGGLNAPVLGSSGPGEAIDNLIIATSSIGSAECDWTGSFLNCTYSIMLEGNNIPTNELYVPAGETFTVTETPVEGWVNGYGVGTFSYDQCVVGNIRVGITTEVPFDVVGYCNHNLLNVVPDTESVMLVEIDKEWVVGQLGGLGAPAQGGNSYGPTETIPGLIIATSDYGTLTCDWYATQLGGYLSCVAQLTNRPPWYNEFDELPVPAGGSYTVTENVPDGWTVLRGTGTFTINNCSDSYSYTTYYEVDGEEQEIRLTECWHEVINQSAEVNADDYYGVQLEKIWSEEIETALTNRGLNSPAGQGFNPDQNFYGFLRAFSTYGEVWCDWYQYGGLSCYYNTYANAPFPTYNYLLVGRGESFTVTEAPLDGFINIRGLGTFDASSCNFVNDIEVGRGYGGYVEVDICRHQVENRAADTEGYYRVVIEKDWQYNDDRGLRAPAQGGGYNPFFNLPNFITLDSSIGTGTCSWVIDGFDSGNLICQYSAKDGQFMPDTSGLWVPEGESYTVSETPPDGWFVQYGTGTFNAGECTGFVNGNTCYHRIVNVAEELPAYRVYIVKAWEGFECGDDYFDECYFGEASANSGLNAPLAGGFYAPGPDVVIRNFITVTSDLGSMSCDWVPEYYDAYYQVTLGELECRITSLAEGYPPFYGGLWVPAGGDYTVTEAVPDGYVVLFGTGTFSIDECLENSFFGGFGNANTIPVGGEYYEDGDECVHLVVNGTDGIEPTPEVTPTEEITPVVTPTEEFTPEVTEVPTDQPTPVTPETPVPTDEPSPEPTPEGVCGDYAFGPDGFPIINLSNAPCGDDSEGEVLNFSPIEIGGAVCIPEALYHSNGGGTWDVWRTADGMEAENLTNNPAGIISMAPTRSPNGRYIVYASNADGDWELYLLDIETEGAQPTQLTNNTQAIDLDPVFSPSGRFIAYESNVDGNWEIRVIDLTTGEKFRVTSHPANDINPFWHPDGDRLLFQSDRTGAWQIFEATTIAGETGLDLLSDGEGEDFDPSYSHDGEQIAFRSERDGETAIYIMDADGSDVRKVSLDGYTASTPVWDTGNRYIAYQASKAGESLNDIFVYDTVTGETRQLTASVGEMANVQDVAPTWLCNSTTVIFTSDVSGNNRLYALNALPMSAPPMDLMGMDSWTENDFNNRDPQNTPSEENGSRMGALPPRR